MKTTTDIGKDRGLKILLRSLPWYTLLLPVFFVVHGWKENFFDLGFALLVPLTGVYVTITLLIFGVSFLVFKSWIRAGLFTMLLMSINFFFGAFHDSLMQIGIPAFFKRYAFLLPAIMIAVVTAFVSLKRTKKKLVRLNYFLNILLLLFVLIDVVSILLLPAKRPRSFSLRDDAIQITQCNTCPRPDVYFLLCDEFASTVSLKENWGFDNSWFDSALSRRGFRVIKQSSSNYNFTEFSMASILNMSYLNGLKNPTALELDDYVKCHSLILNSRVVDFFIGLNYQVINYSFFDLKGNPSPVHQTFLPLKSRLITQQTLLNRMKKDLGHLLIVGRFKTPLLSWLVKPPADYNNNFLIKRITIDAGTKTVDPRFFYLHLNMPHVPYYYDSTGNRRADSIVFDVSDMIKAESYFEHVTYTSKRMIEVVDEILGKSAKPPVILLMGDHGFKQIISPTGKKDQFRNMCAVYVPDRNYKLYNDSVSGVNQFRILFNTLYKQNIPVLKDSSIFLQDKVKPAENIK